MPKITTKTSFCWRHFTKVDGNSAKCNICGKVLKTAGNTTNMKDHLRSLHKIDQHVGVRAVPDSSVAAQVSIAESFRNIADYGIDGDKNKKIKDAIIYMISKDVQPFSIVENPGLLLEIDKRLGSIEQVSILAMATVLDPRFKKLHFKDPQACSNSIIKIKSMVKPMGNDNNSNDEHN
ncbi:uncharacterized protein LOC119562754 isoform X2 [Drosophila subpulchrella]|uniref:uncharacterized protein LOC119562754 isoform X2 n=1 Tax=Drosophila subpulchrella TaxID=1486046 RepID=UPI0018A16EDD|nr:uncharacterized protein LOC119562754 isoform X2 [Drosophila subpulchrella]